MEHYCLRCADLIIVEEQDYCDNCIEDDWCCPLALFLCITIVVFLISSIKPTLSCGLFLFFYVMINLTGDTMDKCKTEGCNKDVLSDKDTKCEDCLFDDYCDEWKDIG